MYCIVMQLFTCRFVYKAIKSFVIKNALYSMSKIISFKKRTL